MIGKSYKINFEIKFRQVLCWRESKLKLLIWNQKYANCASSIKAISYAVTIEK